MVKFECKSLKYNIHYSNTNPVRDIVTVMLFRECPFCLKPRIFNHD